VSAFDDYLLLLLAVVTALGAVAIRDLFGGVLILAAYSFFLALLWAGSGAVDVAFTEAVVGAGLSTVFFFGGPLFDVSSGRRQGTTTDSNCCAGECWAPWLSPSFRIRGFAGCGGSELPSEYTYFPRLFIKKFGRHWYPKCCHCRVG